MEFFFESSHDQKKVWEGRQIVIYAKYQESKVWNFIIILQGWGDEHCHLLSPAHQRMTLAGRVDEAVEGY